MATKVIYFSIGGHDEQAEFSSEDTAENVKGAFHFSVIREIFS